MASHRAKCRGVAEMRLVAPEKLRPREGVALAAEVLERIGRGDAADLRTHAVTGASRHALEETAAERVANSRRVHDPVRRNGGHRGCAAALQNGTAMFAARDDERSTMGENPLFVQSRFLAD